MIHRRRHPDRRCTIGFFPIGAWPFVVAAGLLAGAARAEPYLALRTGAKCVACHVSPTGGGKRSEFGNVYSQTTLAARRIEWSPTPPAAGTEPATWTGRLNSVVAVGGDLRAHAQSVKIPGSRESADFGPNRAQLYLEVRPLGERLAFYVDQRVAPGAATNREAWALLWFANQTVYARAGRMFVPFGLRVEDDTAYIRQVSGVNFNSSDDGVEGGIEIGPWSASASITNGAGGGAETNRGKLFSALATYVQPAWRAGLSASHNNNGAADRGMQSVFGGAQTGSVGWLAAAVFITDDGTPTGRRKQRVSLVEANIEAAKGHNVKLSHEYHDPDVDVREDHRVRYSLVWEVVPFQFTQFRLGARKSDGIPQNPQQNARELFVQWHAFF